MFEEVILRSNETNSRVYHAIHNDDVNTMKTLIKDKLVDVTKEETIAFFLSCFTHPYINETSFLRVAIFKCAHRVFELVLKEGACLTAYYFTQALKHDWFHPECPSLAKIALEQGYDVNLVGTSKPTEALRKFMSGSMGNSATMQYKCNSALMHCINVADVNGLKLMTNYGLKVDVVGACGFTILQCALITAMMTDKRARPKYIEFFRQLVAQSQDPRRQLSREFIIKYRNFIEDCGAMAVTMSVFTEYSHWFALAYPGRGWETHNFSDNPK